MKRALALFFFCIGIGCLHNVMASLSDEALWDRLSYLSSKNLIYSASSSEDEVIDLCVKVESFARKQRDFSRLSKVEQIAVNSYCLKGDIGLAINKAQQMYKEANNRRDALGTALSLQAIGITYMHANQYEQAYSSFEEAGDVIKNADDNLLKIRLMIQQMHVCLNLHKMEEMQLYLLETRRLLDSTDSSSKKDYVFYVQCYQTLYYIGMKEKETAWQSLEQVNRMKSEDGLLWYYHLTSLYYELVNDYDKSLAYNDSTLETLKRNGNINEYKNKIMVKAALLAKKGLKKEACAAYERANSLDDSLNRKAYSRQIDSLHIVYWIDQMELENNSAYNKVLTGGIVCGVFILALCVWLVGMVRRKNKRLEDSRKKLEVVRQEAAESLHSKSLFLSNMSHEIRTPLNAIVGFSGLLTSDEVVDGETRLQCSDLIKQNSDLLLKLVNDVADLSALKSDEMKFTLVTCDVVALCRNVIDTVEKVKHTSASLHFISELAEFNMTTDPERLQQVLINLLVNATKFTSEGKITLYLEIDEMKSEALFTIEDTGCGIPPDKQPHIFNRFEKLHEGIQGAGLGLSICQLIVEHLGGTIWIDAGYTSGARFVFTHSLNQLKQRSV